jgi:hypothetical protein
MPPERTTFKRWENIGGRAAKATDDYHALQPSVARRSVPPSEASAVASDAFAACVARKAAPPVESISERFAARGLTTKRTRSCGGPGG